MYLPIILGWVLYVFAGPGLDNWVKEIAHLWSINIIIASGASPWAVHKYIELTKNCMVPQPNAVMPRKHRIISFALSTFGEFCFGLALVSTMMGWWKDNDEKLYRGLQVSTPSRFKWVNELDETEGKAIATLSATFGVYKLNLTSDGLWNQTTVTKDSIAILGLYNNTATSKKLQINGGTNGSAVYLLNYAPEVGFMMRPLVLSTIDKSLITAWTEDSMVLGWPENGLTAGKWKNYKGVGLL